MTTSHIPAHTELLPAYGRDYKTAAAAKADWQSGKDFLIASTRQACSIRDQAPGSTILLRYKALTQIASFKLPKSA
jgi:hypothetical protein